MEDTLEHKFIQEINLNMGIAHKVCHLYFEDIVERQDVIQEMLYQLWRSYKGFKGNAKFSTWMYRVCFNTAITCLQKSKKSKNETASLNYYSLIQEAGDEDEERRQLLHELIRNLSVLNKSIILLYLEGIKNDEIADIVGLSANNVSVRLVRIKGELRKLKTKVV